MWTRRVWAWPAWEGPQTSVRIWRWVSTFPALRASSASSLNSMGVSLISRPSTSTRRRASSMVSAPTVMRGSS
jgi:hypothetical protein